MTEVKPGSYKGSAGWTTSLQMDVTAERTTSILIKMTLVTLLDAQNLPFVLNSETLTLEFDRPALEAALASSTSTNNVAYEGVVAKYQPNGRNGDGKTAIWVTVTDKSGKKILSITAEL